MEQLKVSIADKILEASAADDVLMKQKLSKIQRFSDFTEACKSLMVKYPQIETELLAMVHDNDFDTARASRRVDAIINRSPYNDPATPVAQEQFLPPANPDEPQVTVTHGKPEMSETIPEPVDEIVYSSLDENAEQDQESLKKERQKKIFSLIWKALAVILAGVVIFLAVKFVINYWKYILIALGVAALVFVLWRYLKSRKQ